MNAVNNAKCANACGRVVVKAGNVCPRCKYEAKKAREREHYRARNERMKQVDEWKRKAQLLDSISDRLNAIFTDLSMLRDEIERSA